MTREEFDKFRDKHYALICEINRNKGSDYAGDQDALANFKKQGEDLGLAPEQIWGVLAGKHWSAITTFIKDGDVKSEPIEGRLHDIILYSFLLLGLVEERKSKQFKADTITSTEIAASSITGGSPFVKQQTRREGA